MTFSAFLTRHLTDGVILARIESRHRVTPAPAVPVVSLVEQLTDRELAILAFERQWWKYAGAKEEAIKELFSMSATRYYQVLNALVDRPESLAADPMLVKRLRGRGAPGRRRQLRQPRGQDLFRASSDVDGTAHRGSEPAPAPPRPTARPASSTRSPPWAWWRP